MLASLIRNVFKAPTKDKDEKIKRSVSVPTSSFAEEQDSGIFTDDGGLIILSNDDPNEDKLNMLLNDDFPTDASLLSGEGNNDRLFMDDIKVDVTLRTQLGQAPALMLLITDPGRDSENPDQPPCKSMQVSICFEVGLNGRISVVDSAGLVKDNNGSSGDTDMQGMENSETKLQEVHKKIVRVLEISQDIGILVEWVLRWLRQRAGSG